MCDAQARVECRRAPAAGHRLIQQAEQPLSIAEIAEYLGVVRLDLERGSITTGGVRILSQFQEGISQVVTCLDQLGMYLQSPLIQPHGIARHAKRPCGVRGIRQHLHVVRLDRERTTPARQGRGPLTLIAQGHRQVAVSLGILRQQFDRSAQSLQGVLVLAQQRHTEDLPEHSGIGVDRQQRTSPMLRLARSVLVHQRDQRTDVARIQPRVTHRASGPARRRAPP